MEMILFILWKSEAHYFTHQFGMSTYVYGVTEHAWAESDTRI